MLRQLPDGAFDGGGDAAEPRLLGEQARVVLAQRLELVPLLVQQRGDLGEAETQRLEDQDALQAQQLRVPVEAGSREPVPTSRECDLAAVRRG